MTCMVTIIIVQINELKAQLKCEFEMKDLRAVSSILDMEIQRDRKVENLYLSQKNMLRGLWSTLTWDAKPGEYSLCCSLQTFSWSITMHTGIYYRIEREPCKVSLVVLIEAIGLPSMNRVQRDAWIRCFLANGAKAFLIYVLWSIILYISE